MLRAIAGTEARIIAALDVVAEYRALDLRIDSDTPRASGKIECFSMSRDERNPSAYIDIATGHYGDSAADHRLLTLWEFAARFAPGRFESWKAAKKFYAEKAGVSLGRGRIADPRDWRDELELEPWSFGNEMLAAMWCDGYKPGVTVEAIRLAGGSIGWWRCYRDKQSGERRRGRFKVLAIPAYAPPFKKLTEPTAWVLWNLTGRELEIFSSKPGEGRRAKMVSCGPTAGTLMNLQALYLLSDAAHAQEIEVVWKTAGPSDMLTLLAAIPSELREKHLVTTNASGEPADVPDDVAATFAGRAVYVVHDCDTAGRVGVKKWLAALQGVSRETRDVLLPYPIEAKHGKDLRDFLTEGL